MENEVIKTIKNRRSIRNYKEEQIKEEELKTILEAGIQAPSANNLQPWHFTVVQNKELIDLMSAESKKMMLKSDNPKLVQMGENIPHIFYNAPTVIIASGKKDIESALVDCAAAIENMLITAESIDLGGVWIGLTRFFFQKEENVKKLDLPTGYKPFYAVALGYKGEKIPTGPSKRKMDVINYIR
ncbi:nitroreductase [Halanaerobium congolense]|uniref:Nitroreductase n=1 Tax=Halanaerobium congolense TaxID=54121 RepID=A0A4R8GAD4_9FIRM|nr:nitroreductase family protein [Halanaerobium congolense]TDX42306.1 nitroreductase [Halanaerobium congolense]